MLRYIFKKLRFWQIQNQNLNEEDNIQKSSQSSLSHDLKKNLNILRDILGTSSDVVIREFAFGHKIQINGALIFIDGLVDRVTINESIIRPLMYDSRLICEEEKLEVNNIDIIKTTLLSVGEVEQVTTINEVVDGCLSGETILLTNGSKEVLVISTRGWENRGVEEPKTDSVVRGPREGFSETLRTNTALLRRKIKNPDFTLETMRIGNRTKTNVCIAYLKGVVNPKLIEEIRRRLKRVNTDAILESGYIEQFIEDAPFSIFSTVSNSENPMLLRQKYWKGGPPSWLTVPLLCLPFPWFSLKVSKVQKITIPVPILQA